MTPDLLDLEELAALEQAATPGPWHADRVQDGDESGPLPEWRGTGMWFTEHDIDADGEPFLLDAGSEHDAALIAALRNAAPALIAAARERSSLHPQFSSFAVKTAKRLGEQHAAMEAERDAALEAVARVETLCKTWDALTKGESPTTAVIRAAVRGDA